MLISLIVAAAVTATASSVTSEWTGAGGSATRACKAGVPQMQSRPSLGATLPNLGKSHGSPAVSAANDVFFVAWNTTGPFVYAWRADGALQSAPLTSVGADIISDSFDALLLHGDLVFAAISSYNSSMPSTSNLVCLHASNLTVAWSDFPTKMTDAAAFATTKKEGQVLLTLVSSDKRMYIRDALSGLVMRTLYLSGQCDWRSSLALNDVGTAAYVLCIDSTFNNNMVFSFDLDSGEQLFAVVYKDLNAYWPMDLAYWAETSLLLGLTGKYVIAIDAATGEQKWRTPLPPQYSHYLLSYAMGADTMQRPILYALVQGGAPTQYTYVLTFNESGGSIAPPANVPLRVDQFQGSMLLAPDGVTVTMNGWDANTANAPALLTSMRLDIDKGAWSTLWTSPPVIGSDGRLALFAAPRMNGSVVVVGWTGVYQFN